MTFHNSAWIASDQPVKPSLKKFDTDELTDMRESLDWERLGFEEDARNRDSRISGPAKKAIEMRQARINQIDSELERRGKR